MEEEPQEIELHNNHPPGARNCSEFMLEQARTATLAIRGGGYVTSRNRGINEEGSLDINIEEVDLEGVNLDKRISRLITSRRRATSRRSVTSRKRAVVKKEKF